MAHLRESVQALVTRDAPGVDHAQSGGLVEGGHMPKQMRAGFTGTPKAGKAGTSVRKFSMPANRLFRPRSGSGIAAHGMPTQINARETHDRREG